MVSDGKGCIYNYGAGQNITIEECVMGNIQQIQYIISDKQFQQVPWGTSALCWSIPSSSSLSSSTNFIPIIMDPCSISPYGYAPNFLYQSNTKQIRLKGTGIINNYCLGT